MARGAQAFRQGQWTDVVSFLNRAAPDLPDSADLHFMLGIAQRELGSREDAALSLALACVHRPAFTEALYFLGKVHAELDDPEEAYQTFDELLSIAPLHAKGWYARAQLDIARGDGAQAIAGLQKACAAAPDLAPALTTLANLLVHERFDIDAALPLAERAVAIAPMSVQAQCNLGMVLHAHGRDADALAACDEALRLSPEHAISRTNRGLIKLGMGDYVGGWEDYAARFSTDAALRRAAEVYPWPEWKGEALSGKTILVYGEQGIGDEMMFASCLPDLIALAGQVVLECAPKLQSLFATSFPRAQVHGVPQLQRSAQWLVPLNVKPAFKVAVGSLPLRFRRSPDAFPATAFLRPDALRRRHWQHELASLPAGLKIGLSWRGGTRNTHAAARSIPLLALKPLLLTPSVHFVNLQYSDCSVEIREAQTELGVRIYDWPQALAEYSETAALVSALDAVVSVRTALVDLSGALGQPIWALTPRVPDAIRTLPWYGSARYRIKHGACWTESIDQVAAELRADAAGHSA